MMVRPSHFGFNVETALTNAFQDDSLMGDSEVSIAARLQFDHFADMLRSNNIDVIVFDENDPRTPDAVFPNNWVSFHEDGKVALYPMMTKNRRLERREDILFHLGRRFEVSSVLDLSGYEKEEKYLEGTGSIVFDYIHKIAYACRSPRTHEPLFRMCCSSLGYTPVIFDAFDSGGKEIYHTNVMMALADDFAVICLESIPKTQRKEIEKSLRSTGRELVDISFEQMGCFAGNMMQLSSVAGKRFMVMSQAAHESLSREQLAIISSFCQPLYANLATIEACGGGSARCMIAGIYLPPKKTTIP